MSMIVPIIIIFAILVLGFWGMTEKKVSEEVKKKLEDGSAEFIGSAGSSDRTVH
ncbi:MAG: hypothetical protein ABIQ32_13285 [Sphingomicrobium sp.]